MTDREKLADLITARTRAILELPVAFRAVFPHGAVVNVPLPGNTFAAGKIVTLSPLGDAEVDIAGKRYWVMVARLLRANPTAGLSLAEVA